MINSGTLLEERKVCVDGTHRARVPTETLSAIKPVFDDVGITRIADVTWLDDIGIPVFQAVRPDAWTLCVSQGKGLTADLAKVSAAMEAIELWHAERLPPGERNATPREIVAEVEFRVDELPLVARSAVNMDARLQWSEAVVVRTGARTWLPTDLLSMDGRVTDRWSVPMFDNASNGLASGNTVTEAVLHGLYEVIERDALARWTGPPDASTVALETVTGPARSLIDAMRRAGVAVRVTALPSLVSIPCFRAETWSESMPMLVVGSGCHLDRDVALCRALTEAAQARVTVIAGTRDDISLAEYAEIKRGGRLNPPDFAAPAGGGAGLDYTDQPTVRQPFLGDDLRMVVSRVAAVTGREPMYADHTRPDLGVPVVRVVCPGLRFDPRCK